jgi:DNA excision repair protein ERCC-6
MLEPSPRNDDAIFDNGYSMPGDIYSKLFDYQRTCSKWLWELHCQETGGIIGDEMVLLY